MPKRKKLPKLPYYEGMGAHSDYAEIQKARPLQSLAETDLTLPEFKILDAYLARINSHDPDKRTVKLEKGELENALGVTQIKQDDLRKRLRNLFQTVEVKDEKKQKGFKLINLFEEADAEQDENGLWQITLTCTASAREYVFNIDNIGYLRYRLKNVVNLTSRYSYVLFLYLVDNRFRKTWSIDLSELKALLNCKGDAYNQYYRFNDLVLKKCQKELCEKTDISFDYKPIKRGRSIAAIEFSLVSDKSEVVLPAAEEQQLEGQLTWSDLDADIAELIGACCNEFDPLAIKQLQAAMDLKGVERDKQLPYLKMQYTQMLGEIQRKIKKGDKPIANRLKYLLKIIERDNYTPEKGKTESSFDAEAWQEMANSFDVNMLYDEEE